MTGTKNTTIKGALNTAILEINFFIVCPKIENK